MKISPKKAGPKKILLVEDDTLMSRMYKRILALDQYEVELAEDGLVGYEKAQKYKPDLILLDIMMPRLNGLQALEKLKADSTTRNIPVIILSNLANKSDAEWALKKGAVQYLIKSEYDPAQVSAIIKDFFKE